MVSEARSPARKGYPYAVIRDGLTYVFETAEELAAFVEEYEREQRRVQGQKALEMMRQLRAILGKRTGGEGIPLGEIDRALREARES